MAIALTTTPTAALAPNPMVSGSHPACPNATIRANGVAPRFCTSSCDISKTAAAESFNPDALPGVTEPFLSKHGFSFASDSAVVPCRGNSSI